MSAPMFHLLDIRSAAGFYDAVIVNDDLEVAYARLKQILLVPES